MYPILGRHSKFSSGLRNCKEQKNAGTCNTLDSTLKQITLSECKGPYHLNRYFAIIENCTIYAAFIGYIAEQIIPFISNSDEVNDPKPINHQLKLKHLMCTCEERPSDSCSAQLELLQYTLSHEITC